MLKRVRAASLLAAGLLLAAFARARAEEKVRFSSGTLTSDYLEYRSDEGVAVARGHALLLSTSTRLEARELRVRAAGRSAEALGNVYLEDADGPSLLAERADYDWARSTGSLFNGYLEEPPLRIWARRIDRLGPDLYRMRRAAVTSCDLDPPHYHFRARNLVYRPGRRVTSYPAGLVLGRTPVFYLPWYTRSTENRRWTITVDPGRSGYHGNFAKTALTYPLTAHGAARVYWDHFERTGNGWGGEYTYDRPDMGGSLYGYRIEDRRAKTRRWNARFAHWQKLTPALSLQANALALSDSNFNNLYFRDDLFRVRSSAESDAALTLQRPAYTARLSAEHDRVFDPLRARFVRQKTVLPRADVQTSSLRFGAKNYLQGSFSVRNEYVRPPDPIVPQRDRFLRVGDASFSLARRLTLTRSATLTPSAGLQETWRSWRDLGPSIEDEAFFQGAGFTGLALRQRLTRRLDLDLAHAYRVRWSVNQFKRDHAAAADQGLEANALSAVLSYIRPSFLARLSSGYDLRDRDGETLKSPRRKTVPPVLDLSLTPARNFRLGYRHAQSLYPARRPQAVQFSARAGRPGLNAFTQFSYNESLPGRLQARHGAAFPLTRGWEVEGDVRYVLAGPGRLRYDSVPKDRLERNLTLRRDLHCWYARVQIRQRPGLYEVLFRIDLKVNSRARSAGAPDERQYYPGRPPEEGK